MGFFPMFEIYVAIPSSMALGLDMVSSVIWACIGNFMAIPFIVYFYNSLSRINIVNKYFQKLSGSKFSEKIRKGSMLFIVFGTPIVGSWAIGVLGKVVGLDKKSLFLSSGLSIFAYGIIIGVLTKLGIDTFF